MPMATRYSDLYPLVVPWIPGFNSDNNGLLLQSLQWAGREFCIRTEAWKEQLESIDIVEDQVDYDIESTYDAEIVRIDELRINTEDGVENGDDGALIDEEYYEYDPTTGVLTLDDSLEPEDDVTDGLDIKIVIVPTLRCNELEESFLNRYADGIIGGAMYYMMMMPMKPWTNIELAMNKYAMFTDRINRAKIERQRLYRRSPPEFSP